MNKILSAAVAATLLAGGAAHAQDVDPKWELSTGFDYGTGDYGGDVDSDYYRIPLEAKVTLDRLRFQVIVPWVSIDGPANLVEGGVVGGPSTETSQRSGLGDISATAGVTVLRADQNRSGLELAGRVKLPTADDDIGTGETDFAAQVNGYKAVSDTATLFGSLGYEWMGDPEAYDVEDGFLASAGVNLRPSDRYGFGAAAYYREAYVEGGDDYASITPYVYTMLSDTTALRFYASAGLTDAAPDIAAGFRVVLYK